MIFFSALLLVLSFKSVGGFSSRSIISASTTRTGILKTSDNWSGTSRSECSEHVTVCCSTILRDRYTDICAGSISTILSDDIRNELQSQNPNEDAPVYDYYETGKREDGVQNNVNDNIFRSMTELDEITLEDHKHIIQHDHYETRSLDDLFPNKSSLGFSATFNSCASFRNDLRDAMRHDIIFDSNADGTERIKYQPPIYGQMTNEQRHEELAKNKPLIGYWKHDDDSDTTTTTSSIASSMRMKKTTETLIRYLGPDAPTGDHFFEAIGSLCNSTQAPYHWTEVVGVAATQNSKMGDKTEHAWHQDYGHLEDRKSNHEDTTSEMHGKSEDSCYPYQSNNHVFLAFPFEDNYQGTGVFSHLIKLKHEQWTKPKGDLVPGKSIFYSGIVPDRYIVRPRYVPGSELIVFRDIDVLHSTPDIQYRTSIMRFG